MNEKLKHIQQPLEIPTFTGKWVNPFALRPEDIDLADIVVGLSHRSRFAGHTFISGEPEFYSVAQHSVLCAQHAPDSLKPAMLLHDAYEAYGPDYVAPVKGHFYVVLPTGGYNPEPPVSVKDLESRNMATIMNEFRLLDDWILRADEIKDIDLRMVATEVRDLCGDRWDTGYKPYPERIRHAWPPEYAVAQMRGACEDILRLSGRAE